MSRAALRAQVFELDEGQCRWPGCKHRADELAHLHSRGMGGRRSADTVENCMAACQLHARMSDGLQPNGWPDFVQQHILLLGEGWEARIPMSRWGFERAEALTRLVAKRRGEHE